MSDPIFRTYGTDDKGQVVVYDTLCEKVARQAMYDMLQSGYSGVGVRVVSQFA